MTSGPVPPRKVYLPVVQGGSGPAAAATPDLGVLALDLFLLILDHPDQKRPRLNFDADLARVAMARVQYMTMRKFFGHTDPEGYGPNVFAMGHGIDLPDWYDTARSANQIESLALDKPDAATVLAALLASPPHHDHILGIGDFYRGQSRCGIGVSPTWETPVAAQFIFCILTVHP